MAFPLLIPLIAAGATIIGGGISAAVSSSNASKQISAQQDMQEDSQEYNSVERLAAQQFVQDMWNKNNAYNLPSEQVKRLRAAGLNPLSQTMQGSNAQMVGSSPQASSGIGSASQAQTPQFNLGSDVVNAFSAQSNIKFQESASRKTEAEAQGIEIDNQTRSFQNLLNLMESRARVENSDMDTQEKKRKLDLIDAQTTQVLRQIDIDYKRLSYEERNTEVNEFNAETQRMAVGIQSVLANSKVKVDAATITNLAASAANLQQQVTSGKISNGQAALEFKKQLRFYNLFYKEDNWDSIISYGLDQLKTYIPFLRVGK